MSFRTITGYFRKAVTGLYDRARGQSTPQLPPAKDRYMVASPPPENIVTTSGNPFTSLKNSLADSGTLPTTSYSDEESMAILRNRGFNFGLLPLTDHIGAPECRDLPEISRVKDAREYWEIADSEGLARADHTRVFQTEKGIEDHPASIASAEAYLRITPTVTWQAQSLIQEANTIFSTLKSMGLDIVGANDSQQTIWCFGEMSLSNEVESMISDFVAGLIRKTLEQAGPPQSGLIDPEASTGLFLKKISQKLPNRSAVTNSSIRCIMRAHCWWNNAASMGAYFTRSDGSRIPYRDLQNPFARLHQILLLGLGVSWNSERNQFTLAYQ